MRVFRFFLALFVIVAGVGVTIPLSAQAVSLPGGHSRFVLSFMAYRTQNPGAPSTAFERVSEITFNPNGTLSERYWSWNAGQTWTPTVKDPTKGDWMSFRVGTTSRGCGETDSTFDYPACGVWAPKGFETAGSTRTATWRIASVSGIPHVVIYWDSTGIRETYRVNTANVKLTELILTSNTHPNMVAAYARAYGSNHTGPGVSPAATRTGADGKFKTLGVPESMGGKVQGVNIHTKRWTPGSSISAKQLFYMSDFTTCSASSNCMVAGVFETSKWHRYLYFEPGTRKVTWLNMKIGASHTPTYKDCINKVKVGGHQWAMLQIIDDDGRFQGFVGVEASLYGQSDPSHFMAMMVALSY